MAFFKGPRAQFGKIPAGPLPNTPPPTPSFLPMLVIGRAPLVVAGIGSPASIPSTPPPELVGRGLKRQKMKKGLGRERALVPTRSSGCAVAVEVAPAAGLRGTNASARAQTSPRGHPVPCTAWVGTRTSDVLLPGRLSLPTLCLGTEPPHARHG